MGRFFYFYPMSTNSFLAKLAQQIIQNHSYQLTNVCIILPNKRAKIFLLEAFKNQLTHNSFAPEIISIEDFIQNLAKIRSVDSIELLFEFYTVYKQITPTDAESFENFASWAKTLLADFNEIDRYLIEPNVILKHLENIKEIEHWSVQPEKTELIEKYLAFWKKIPTFYHELTQHLKSKGIGYQGLIYREAVYNLTHYSENKKNKKIVFAGFNALNQAEEKIIQHLLAIEMAEIYWDFDQTFLHDQQHDAGLFQRRIKKEWHHYQSNEYQWIFDEFKKEKNIQIIGTSKQIGQAMICGSIINKIAQSNELSQTAIVLADENLLLPVLYELPNSVSALNITMGFTGKHNPAQLLIQKIFKLHLGAQGRKNGSNYVFYYQDLLDVLTHPFVEPYGNYSSLIEYIKYHNYTFITLKKIQEICPAHNNYFELLIDEWHDDAVTIIERLLSILLQIKSFLDNTKEEEKIANAFLYSIYQTLIKLQNNLSSFGEKIEPKTLYSIYKNIADLIEVSFQGEPLEGLQIMGVLESRVLDFKNIIITSVNEGNLPAGKSQNTFLPYDLRMYHKLPTFKEKDAIYSYHFYHLLQRAENVYLLYNSDTDGFDGGEKSRFITQLLVENYHIPTVEIYNPFVPQKTNEPFTIPKTKSILNRLTEIATSEKGFSPTSITTYIRNPLTFYFQKILKLSEAEEVEENIASNTLGTIIHGVLEELYQPLIGKLLIPKDIENCFPQIEQKVIEQFRKEYKEGDISQGKNLLAYEVAKRNVYNFLKMELNALNQGDQVQIISLEATFSGSITLPENNFKINLGGKLDRIEYRNNKIRIIDYKTGKVEPKNLKLKYWDGLTSDIVNEKIIQMLTYALMHSQKNPTSEIEAGIICFKNMKEGFMPFQFENNSLITQDVLKYFHDELLVFFRELFNPNLPFQEKK